MCISRVFSCASNSRSVVCHASACVARRSGPRIREIPLAQVNGNPSFFCGRSEEI